MGWWYEEDWCGKTQCPTLWVIGDEAIDSTGMPLGPVVRVTRTGWPVVRLRRRGRSQGVLYVQSTALPASAPELLMPVRSWVLPH